GNWTVRTAREAPCRKRDRRLCVRGASLVHKREHRVCMCDNPDPNNVLILLQLARNCLPGRDKRSCNSQTARANSSCGQSCFLQACVIAHGAKQNLKLSSLVHESFSLSFPPGIFDGLPSKPPLRSA